MSRPRPVGGLIQSTQPAQPAGRARRARVAAAVGVLAALFAGCDRAGEPLQTSTPHTSASTIHLPRGATVEEEAGQPIGVTDVGGKAWFGLNGTGEVRLGTGATVVVGSHPLRLAPAPDGGAWVSVFGDGMLVRLDPHGSVAARVPFGHRGSPEGIATDGAELWVVDEDTSEVAHLDSGSGTEVGRFAVGSQPRLLALDATRVWVTSWADGGVTAVDRRTGAIGPQRLRVCLGPQGIALAGGVVWVACTADNVVVALDPTDLSELARLPLPYADALTAADSRIFAVGQKGPTVLVIDAVTRKDLARIPLGTHPPVSDGNVGVAVSDHTLVVTHPEAARIWRLPLPVTP